MLYIKDIIRLCNGELVIGNENTLIDNLCIDTRLITNNNIFIGIKGEKINGNSLYKEALSKGAIGCILDNDTKLDYDYLNNLDNVFIVLVDNTIECLKDLAIYKRSLVDIPVIGITGSVGKTSTKDLVYSVLKQKYNVLKTKGNFNNEIGLPLTILSLRDENCMVLEMGMNHFKEISTLTNIAKPSIGIITNIGTAHIGNLGSRENILKAKLEILEGIDNKLIVINNDIDLLHEYSLNNKCITYGINNESNIMAYDINEYELYSIFKVNIDNNFYEFRINTPGRAYIYNALSAICIGIYYNIDIIDIIKGISEYNLTNGRMQIENMNNITIINDCYNANYDSMENVINYLGRLNTRKIAVIGDMLELGEYSEELHRKVGKCILNNNIDIVVLVGNESKFIYEEIKDKDNVYHFNNNIEAINKLNEIKKDNDTILLKASNGMNFIEIYNYLKK